MNHKLYINKTLTEGDLNHTYSPLQNLLQDDKSVGDFIVKNKFNLSLNYPLNIECQPSYDGTVNLIINDDINPPRIINTRFSKIEDNRFKVINRNQTAQSNIYNPDNIDLETRLFRTCNTFPVLDLMDINYGGKLIGGNYTFYIKFADSDENETDIVCESSTVSIFNGTLSTISSITGTLLNEETDKAITLSLSNIDTTFPKFYVYYSRETSDLNGFRTVEFGKFTKPYGWIKESGTPPFPHWDCILMTDTECNLGDEVEIKVIGVFKRTDFDHKYVVVESSRDIQDISELMEDEMDELKKLYPRISEGEGWFGKDVAEYCMKNHEKSL